MKSFRLLVSIAALTGASLALSTWAATESQPEVQDLLPAVTDQAAPGKQDMGRSMRAGTMMPGYADQMKAMQELHDRMLAGNTREERNALMAEQMELMRKGMNMMGGMGGMGGMGAGAGKGKAGDMSVRQGMMEERMDMMQSMMQIMMDRMQAEPATE